MLWIYKIELCFMSQTGSPSCTSTSVAMPRNARRRRKESPEGMILYLKTRCFWLLFFQFYGPASSDWPINKVYLCNGEHNHSDQMKAIKSILQCTQQHSWQLWCHSFDSQKKRKQHKCLQCELSVSSYRCLLINSFHLEWCSVFRDVCCAAETDRELPWKCFACLRACVRLNPQIHPTGSLQKRTFFLQQGWWLHFFPLHLVTH